MTTALPCPNPACTHQFSADELRRAALLTCPRCSTRFQFRHSGAPPTSVPPLARPVARTHDTPPQDDSPLTFTAESGIVAPGMRRPPAARSRRPAVLLAAVLGGCLAVGIVVAILLRGSGGGDSNSGPRKQITGRLTNAQSRPEDAFRLLVPRDTWLTDTKLADQLGALVALRRAGPEAFLAVAARDYGRRRPRDAELLGEAVQRLERCFGDTLELGAAPEPTELRVPGTQRVHKLDFKGQAGDYLWRGECYLLTRDGFGYCLFVAGSPDLKAAHAALEELQQEKHWFDPAARPGWAEESPKLVTFKAKGGGLQVKGPAEVWNGDFNPADEDERGVLFLHGTPTKAADPTARNIQSATVLVVADKETTDLKELLKVARARLEERKKIEDDRHRVEAASDKGDEGYAADVGDRRGRLLELRLVGENGPKKYLLLAAVAREGRAFVIVCECGWEHRQVWRSDFLELLATVRL